MQARTALTELTVAVTQDYVRSQGTAKRWDQVAAYVRTRTVDEVIEMAKHGLAAGKGAPRQVLLVHRSAAYRTL